MKNFLKMISSNTFLVDTDKIKKMYKADKRMVVDLFSSLEKMTYNTKDYILRSYFDLEENFVKEINSFIESSSDVSSILIRTMLESGVKLGVSSRGSGEVDSSGSVQGFEIITVDIVAQPSAPGAYPTPVYEHLMNTKGGFKALQMASEVKGNPQAQKYIAESLVNIIRNLK